MPLQLLRIHDAVTLGYLTTGKPGLKYREIPAKTSPPPFVRLETFRIYDLKVDLSSKP